MKDVTDKNFGVIIAFLLPGFILLWGLSYSSVEVATWLAKASATDSPSVGGFLYATLASLALGLLISAIRWAAFDNILLIGLPAIDFSKLKDKDVFSAFTGVVENHYRYYQYYSNTLVAVILGFASYARYQKPTATMWFIMVVTAVILLLASRDCLKKYRQRAAAITS